MSRYVRKDHAVVAANLTAAEERWGTLSELAVSALREISERHDVSVRHGDLLFLDGSWYISHTGLLSIARRHHCHGIHVEPAFEFCNPATSRSAFKATVYKSRTCRGFVGYGDADPSNVSPQVRGAEMRVAETRAVNRALRKAYGIGICSVEELGTFSSPLRPAAGQKQPRRPAQPGDGNGYHPLRDRLCLLIRQHHLDPALVKSYASDYCDVAELRLATREQIADFIKHLSDYARNDREGLRCQLNSYARKAVAGASAETTDDSSPAGQAESAGAA